MEEEWRRRGIEVEGKVEGMGEGLREREGRGERQRAREEGWVKREGEGGRVGTKKRYTAEER